MNPDDGAGVALALTAAIGFGLAIPVARFAYQGGTNGLTVASIRTCVATLVLVALCAATVRSMRVTRRDWLHLTGLGVMLSMLFYGNIGSVEYISVGLAALLVFTYPTMIATLGLLPAGTSGWGGLIGVVALQSLLAPACFAGIARIGALKSGMLSNIQPATSIVAAFLLFGEWLTPTQLLGGVMVIAGILLMQWHDARAASRAA